MDDVGYDPEGYDWMDASVMGSIYEVQIAVNKSGKFRHRERRAFLVGEWVKGKPVDNSGEPPHPNAGREE